MLFWLTLAFALLLILGSIAYAALKGLEFWRAFKLLSHRTTEELDRIARATAEIELHLQAAAASGTKLDASLTRLRSSRARLTVLTTALADVRASVGRITGVMPRK